jgi:class 3 adenylate cyclase
VLLLAPLLSSYPAYTQSDTLLNRSFNDRYRVLLQLFGQYSDTPDTSVFSTQMHDFTSFAKAKNDPKLLLELQAIQIKRRYEKGLEPRQAIEDAFNQAISTAENSGYRQIEATLEYYLADFYWRVKDYPLAIQHGEKADIVAGKLAEKDFFLKRDIAYQLGSNYYTLTDYAVALYYLQKALNHTNSADSLHARITLYNTLGLAYLKLNKLDSATINLHKALDNATRTNSQAWIGNVSGNLGHIYMLQGELDKGEALLFKDKEISLKTGAKSSAAGAFMELASINFNKGNHDLASEQLDSAILLMNGNMPFHRKGAMYPLLSKVSAYKGRWQDAARYMDSTLVVMDSLSRMDNAVQILRLKQLIELQKSRVEIAQREVRIRKKTMEGYVMIAGLLFTLIAGGLVYRQKRRADHAKKRSDDLLLNILPKEVAEELKTMGISRAKRFEETSILFCDFKNFTLYSEEMPPEAVVQILNDYFMAFDAVVNSLGLEKIKTVGDAYICAAGLPAPEPRHAEKTVLSALKIQEIMRQSPAGWQLRIGIHSGPVVAGIVGIKKFAYDVWGDTVNTAARMEQHTEPGKVNISQATYELVKDKFHCTHRGKMEVKHKGEMDMYYVEGVVGEE